MSVRATAPSFTECGMLDDPSDHLLLRDLRDGDDGAAAQLYERYVRRLLALTEGRVAPDLAGRLDPEDVVQSVFRSFFRRAQDGLYDVPVGEDLWPLLLVIALNKLRTRGTYHRAARRDVRRERGGEPLVRALEQLEAREPQPFLRLVALEALDGLPAGQRQVAQWRLEGYEVAEIATRVGRSKRSVERLLKDCRESLRHLLPNRSTHAGIK
jgi:RNA polymerase sigma-70 factor (ECF subfamily)